MRSIRSAALLAAFQLFLTACSGGAPDDEWAGTMETRADGVVIVRNPQEGAWPPGGAWRLEEELRISGATAPGRPMRLGEVVGVEVDSLGRMWVLDRDARQVRVFDARGRYVRSVGRPGRGLGELADPIAMTWAPDGTMWIVDPMGAGYTVFDTAGRFIASHPRRIVGHLLPWQGGFGVDGMLHELATIDGGTQDAPRLGLVRFDAGMEPLDTFPLPDHRAEQFELRRGSSLTYAPVPFSPRQIVAFDPRGLVWMGVSDRYRLAQRRVNGDTTRIVEREAPPVPVTEAEREDAVAGLRWFTDEGGEVDAARIPGTKAAFEQLLLDEDGGFWVRPALSAAEQGAAFDVFDAEGRYRGRLFLPGGMDLAPAPVIRGGALYGVSTDASGARQVVRARIVRGG